jgi:hypothetical protein
MRRASWTVALALAGSALLAGCGGGDDEAEVASSPTALTATRATTPAGGGAQAVIDAYDRLLGTSYRATVIQTTSFDASRAPVEVQTAYRAASGRSTTEVEAESARRVRAVVDVPQPARDPTLVLYDGETFVSVDGGEFRRLTDTLGALFSELSSLGSDQFASRLRGVRAEGAAVEAGVTVRRYTATVDPAYLSELSDRLVAGLGIDPSAVSSRDARLVMDLLPDGGLARQATTATAEIDLSEQVGSEAVVVTTVETEHRIRDAGAPISIPKPEARGEVSDLAELQALLSP